MHPLCSVRIDDDDDPVCKPVTPTDVNVLILAGSFTLEVMPRRQTKRHGAIELATESGAVRATRVCSREVVGAASWTNRALLVLHWALIEGPRPAGAPRIRATRLICKQDISMPWLDKFGVSTKFRATNGQVVERLVQRLLRVGRNLTRSSLGVPSCPAAR